MITLLLTATFVVASEMHALIRTAPIGYENERGFHFGLDPELKF